MTPANRVSPPSHPLTAAPARPEANAPAAGLAALDRLVQDTFALWSHRRVGFSWRNYYYAHTVRVGNLCQRLADREGGDPTALAFAALLHDITKRYDGPFLTNTKGERLVDRRGLWLTKPLLPDRGEHNIATRLYRFYDAFGAPHSESGALIAETLMRLHGLPAALAAKVREIVQAHLLPEPEANLANRLTIEDKILRDADLMDSNLGLVAFYRNVQIHIHRRVEDGEAPDLRAYVHYVPRWLTSKDRFLGRLHTTAGRQMAEARLSRCLDLHRTMAAEAERFDLCRRFGVLGVFDYFTTTIHDPDFFAELDHLQTERLPSRRAELASLPDPARSHATAALADAERFCRELRLEAEGGL